MSTAALSTAPQVHDGPIAGDEGTAMTVAEERPTSLAAPADRAAGSITDLLRLAVEKGTPVEQLEKLVELHERMERREAAREFARAMAAFQAECPSIKKARSADITTKGGGKFSYTYADLDDIVRIVRPILAKHGLSYSWDTKVSGKQLAVVCTVSHLNGHSTASSFELPIDNPSAMSDQQKVGAANMYAKRQSLSSVLGISTSDDDDTAGVDPTTINDDQITAIEDLLTEAKANRARFLQFMNVKEVSHIRAAEYQRAINALQTAKERKSK